MWRLRLQLARVQQQQQQQLLLCALQGSRQLSTSGAACQEHAPVSSSSAPGPPTGLLSRWLSGSRVTTPLVEPLPSAPTIQEDVIPTTVPGIQVSSLGAGLQTGTLSFPGPLASLALFVKSGSAAETSEDAGASSILQSMAFKATTNRTTFRLTRELEKYGAITTAGASRETVAYQLDIVKSAVPEGLELLMDSVLNPRLHEWEVEDTLDEVREELLSKLARPELLLKEVLHRAAFSGGLGRPFLVDPAVQAAVHGDALRAFVAQHYVPRNMVLAAVGVEHDQVKRLVGPMLGGGGGSAAGGPSTPAAAASSSPYVGGVVNCVAPLSLSYAAVAFEVPGGLSDVKSAATAAVLKSLLDDARAVVPYVTKGADTAAPLTPLLQLYRSTGLIGLAGATGSADVVQVVATAADKLQSLAKAVPDVRLAHAKASVLKDYEEIQSCSTALAKEIGFALVARGKFNVSEYPSVVKAIKASDVTAFLRKVLGTNPTCVTYSNLQDLPRSDALSKYFSKAKF